MNNLNLNTEMRLTNKEIKLIALEAEGVDANSPNAMDDFSNRAFKMIYKANGSPSYVIKRCYFLIYGVKLS